MTAVLMVLAFLAVVALCYAMWLFDCLLRWEYEHHCTQWEADGKSGGFYWQPDDAADFFHGRRARLQMEWTFASAPDWALGNPQPRRWLVQMRAIAYLFLVIWLVVAARFLVVLFQRLR